MDRSLVGRIKTERRRGRLTDRLKVFAARKIITMETNWPKATAVAIRSKRVVSVGRTLEDLCPCLDAFPHDIDERFADKVLIPGFVEPHLHALLAALHFPSVFVTADDWNLPYGKVGGTSDKDKLLNLVPEKHREMNAEDEWLFVFGDAIRATVRQYRRGGRNH